MPPRKRAVSGPPALTDDDVADIRARLGQGEKPRVVVRAASAAVPAGTRGNVIRLGDPREGEYVVVRLGRDEVPFAPAELGLPTRGKSASTSKGRPAAPAKAAKTAKKAAARPATKSAPQRRPAAAATRSKETSAAKTTARTSTRSSRRTARSSRRTPPLTVTLRFTDGTWSVEAQRGARRLAKAAPLRPGAVKAFADHVDTPEVREALTETVESCRAVVAERADKLRTELAAAEAALKEYEARRR